jgi:hypothetical protein
MEAVEFPRYSFGAEFEMFIPNPTGSWTLSTIADFLTDKGVSALAANYHGENYDKWQIKSDRSIAPGSASQQKNAFAFEIVSPILKGEIGLETIKRVLQIVKNMGVKVNKSCGFHVHIGGWTADDLHKILLNCLKFETVFDSLVPPSRRNNQYCKSNNESQALRDKNPRQKFDVIKQNRGNVSKLRTTIQDSRYFKFNLPDNKQTIEFRQHSATYEWTKACKWIRLLLIFVDNSISHPPRLNFNQTTDVDTRFDTMFSIVISNTELKEWAKQRKSKFENN